MFQFQNGSINSQVTLLNLVTLLEFQFQNGSINRNTRKDSSRRIARFNSKMVRLIACLRLRLLEGCSSFQFQNGSINRIHHKGRSG